MRIIKREKRLGAEVPMSPLIDCVFLLLVFFLVTSMIKRFEQLIPVQLADPSSMLSAEERVNDVYELGIDTSGAMYAQGRRTPQGQLLFNPVNSPEAFLNELALARGTELPVQVTVERGTSFQTVIRTQDLLELQQFRNVRFRVRDGTLGRGAGTRRDVNQ
ncbi:MAG: biopolymer transporter ExbD [Phycisphaerae bacterium]